MFLLRTSFQFHCNPIVFQHFFYRIPSSPTCSFAIHRYHLKLRTDNFITRAISSRAESSALEMVKAIRVHELGGPEVLKWEDVDIGEPKEGEVRVRNKAIGLNFIHVYFRKGVYKADTMPFTPGREAAGVVTAVGPGVSDR